MNGYFFHSIANNSIPRYSLDRLRKNDMSDIRTQFLMDSTQSNRLYPVRGFNFFAHRKTHVQSVTVTCNDTTTLLTEYILIAVNGSYTS